MSHRSPLGGRGNVLSIRPFRRLWVALTLASLGDWLSLLALSSLAADIGGRSAGVYAVSGVWLTSLLPALVLGPLAGAVADKFDRRMNMIIGDLLRAVLYITIPLNMSLGFANRLTWIYVIQFLASAASLFWAPAKDASMPNLVPPDKLEGANQLSLLSTYGTAPIAGLLFSGLAVLSTALGHLTPYFSTNQFNLSLYFRTAMYLVSAWTIYSLHELRRRPTDRISSPSVLRSIWDGWKFAGQSPLIRGITIGMTGAFAAGGVVVGLGPAYIRNVLRGGGAGWGVAFAALFIGLPIGMFLGLRVLRGFSLRRLFGLSIIFAALPLAVTAVIPSLIVTVILAAVLGACAGVAYVTGYTIIGLEVGDEARGRTFAFLQSALRVILFAAIAVAPILAGAISSLAGAAGSSSVLIYRNVGYNGALLLAAVVAVLLGYWSYRQMDDRRGVPLLADLGAALRWHSAAPVDGQANGGRANGGRANGAGGAAAGGPANGAGRGAGGAFTPAGAGGAAGGAGAGAPWPAGLPGLLLALEGGEGTGKSTQARLLAIWLRDQGYDVVATREPGATKIGMRLRALLLDTAHTGLAPRAEALMYAADRAEHVHSVIIPALERGAIVVTDRYVDSSLAYQGAGRDLPVAEIAELSRFATGGLVPGLTVLLDLPPETGLSRRHRSADRLEAEPLEFHERVRQGFLRLAAAEPDRYLLLDAGMAEAEVAREIQLRVRELLPDPVPETAEETTGSFPAVRE